MKFILSFSVGILFLTFFWSIWVVVILSWVFFVLTLIAKVLGEGGVFSLKTLVALFLWLLVAGFSVVFFSFRHQDGSREWQTASSYIWTGTIRENHGRGRYLLRDEQGRDMLYYSNQDYRWGALFFVTARFQPGMSNPDRWRFPSKQEIHDKILTLGTNDWTFDMSTWMFMKWRQGTLYEDRALVQKDDLSERSALVNIRQYILSLVGESFSSKTAGLTQGVLIWDRSWLTKEDYQSFIDSWLVHIIAVSGGNIVLIVWFLSAILFFLPFYGRVSIVATSVVIYAIICGGDSSVVRATCMALLWMAAIFSGRPVSVWRIMRYVYIWMLVRNPYYLLYDLGFVFSFSALAGLVYFAERRKVTQTKKFSPFHYIRSTTIIPSVAASLGIIAPLLFFTSRVNLLSTMSNIVIVPIIPFVMIYGFLGSLLYSLTWRQRLVFPQEWAVDWIYYVSNWTNTHEIVLSTSSWWARGVVLSISVLVVIILLQKTQTKE